MQGSGDQAFLHANSLKENWREPSYAGATSFLRRPYSRELEGVDVVVSGVPYDNAVTNRPGCRLGPRAIRAASVQLSTLGAFPFGFDPLELLSVVDYGDVFLDPHHPATIYDAIETHADTILSSDAKMLTFGGDHSVSYPLLKAYAKKHGPIALVQFDAHCDTWPNDETAFDHGAMFHRAVVEGIVDVTKSTQVGLRTFNDSDWGFEILTSPWIHRNGIDAAIEIVRERAGDTPVYISFDVDGMDPAFAPGTGTPVSGGLASWQALEFIRGLAGLNLVGMDVVEVAPPYDHAEITAIAAASVAYDWLCLIAKAQGAQEVPVGRL